jgi:outer membrane protein, heavy metal efflux system
MHLIPLAPLAVAVVLGLIGCATPGTEVVSPAPRLAGKDVPLDRLAEPPSMAAPGPPQRDEPTGVLTLRQALALALLQNPELAASSWEVRAAEARTLQAGLLSNPELDITVENFAGSGAYQGVRAAETTLRLSQAIELGGKRRRRTQAAALERDLAAWDYETKRVDVLSEVTKAFVEVLRAQERLETQTELVRLAGQVLAAVAERVKAGKVSPMEESKARVALSTSHIALERARGELDTARRRLAATWGSTTPAFQKAAGAFDAVTTPPPVEQLAQRVLQNPDLARWSTEMQQRQAAVALAQVQKFPDLTAGAGVRYFSDPGDAALVFELSLPLPLFDRNQGGILEAQSRLAKATEERRAAAVRVQTALGTAYTALATAFAEVTTLHNAVLPESRRAFEATSEGYRQGKFGLLDVLDAQRTLFEAREQYIDALADYHKAVVEIERLLGEGFETVIDTPASERQGGRR